MLTFKNMPPGYSRAKDVLRFIQLLVIGFLGIISVKLFPDTHVTGILLAIWIVGFSAASVFFGARAVFSWVFRL
jgi:hypothetical protein